MIGKTKLIAACLRLERSQSIRAAARLGQARRLKAITDRRSRAQASRGTGKGRAVRNSCLLQSEMRVRIMKAQNIETLAHEIAKEAAR